MLPLPEPLIISDQVTTPFLYPRSKSYGLTESWEMGGVALSDPSEEMTKYAWHGWMDKTNIYIKRADLATEHLLLTDEQDSITEIDITFDQNMRQCVAWVSGGVAKLYWYNSAIENYDITSFSGIRNPRVSLDDKRRFNVANSDIIFAYLKGTDLCYRLQRERYSTEYVLVSDIDPNAKLQKIGMGTQNRFLFYVR